jgi:Predicted Zn-dependent protease (DUF2268)
MSSSNQDSDCNLRLRIGVAVVIAALACAALSGAARSAASMAFDAAAGPTIHTEDVDRFYQVYDTAGGHPTAAQLQHDYIDPGSDGLHQFATVRNISGTRIAETLAKHPEIYSSAKRCMVVLPRVRQRLEVALRTLGRLYPEARFPPVTIAVGRGKPVGVGSPVTGLQIGLEALCATDWLNPNVEDRFVHVIAHEYAHIQQVSALVDDEHPTVLELSLVEGAAEFTAELISGEVAYSQFRASTKGREKEIETAFVSDEEKTDLSQWLNNSTLEKPGDLGYWVGYRIVKSYYQHASDKRQVFREILKMTDPKGFLAKSDWYPGIRLNRAAESPWTHAALRR